MAPSEKRAASPPSSPSPQPQKRPRTNPSESDTIPPPSNPSESATIPPPSNPLQDLLSFWLSPANLSKDRHLKKLFSEAPSGWLSAQIFTTFQKAISLQATPSQVAAALHALSFPHIALRSQDADTQLSVPNLAALISSAQKAARESTIYLEPIPPTATRADLQAALAPLGPIAYLSIPRFPSGTNKGFAFIELNDPSKVPPALHAIASGALPAGVLPAPRALAWREWHERKDEYKARKRRARQHLAAQPPPASAAPPAATVAPPTPRPSFTPGLLLRVSGLRAAKQNPSAVKLQRALRAHGAVAHVDFSPALPDVCTARFVRREDAAAAAVALAPSGESTVLSTPVNARVMSGEDEAAYWTHVAQRRAAYRERAARKDAARKARQDEAKVLDKSTAND